MRNLKKGDRKRNPGTKAGNKGGGKNSPPFRPPPAGRFTLSLA